MTKDELHAAIMNIPCHGFDYAYKQGHKDARHAAAELVLSAPPQPTERSAELEAVQRDAMRYRHLKDCNSSSLMVMKVTGMMDDDYLVLTGGHADEAIDAEIDAIAAAPQKGEEA